MRLVSTEILKPKMIIGKSIFNERNQVLLHDGVELTEKLIGRLINLGVTFVYIKESETEEIVVPSSPTDAMRRKSVAAIQETFYKIAKQETTASSSIVLGSTTKQFTAIICSLLNSIKNEKELLNILSDVYIHDDYVFTHSFNVTLYSLAIGFQLRLNEKQLEMLSLGALFHDVGKMKISQDIFKKPGELTPSEFEEVKQHTVHGFEMLKKITSIPLLVAHCAYQHHERLDGSGYPRGIKDKDIHIFGKIIAVADVFDAVTSSRVYRQAMLPHEGLEILYAGCGTLFSRTVVEAFRKAVAVYPVGLTVVLSNQKIGVVKRQNIGLSDRPVVQITSDRGIPVKKSYDLDLSQHFDVVIVECDQTLLSRSLKMLN